MKKPKLNASDISVFSVIFFITFIFLTFDIYCKNQVTPETPLLNIAGLPFLRMDFVMLVFALAFLAGVIISKVLKKVSEIITPLALGGFGCIAIFLFLFDVNTMQLIAPTMRISHVIMTVSRVLAIVAGASGIFAGVALTNISKYVSSKKPIIISSVSAIILSIIANAENLQTGLYLVCGVLLLVSSVIFDFSNKDNMDIAISEKRSIKIIIADFISASSLTAVFGILYSVLCNNAGFGESSFIAISGLVLLVLVISVDLNVANSIALFFGSVISYTLIHYSSDVVSYSGNRVIYVVPYSILIVSTVFLIIKTVDRLIQQSISK